MYFQNGAHQAETGGNAGGDHEYTPGNASPALSLSPASPPLAELIGGPRTQTTRPPASFGEVAPITRYTNYVMYCFYNENCYISFAEKLPQGEL